VLITLGQEEVKDILREQGSIDIDCEFCNEHYSFDEVDSKELFATNCHHPSSKTQH
jgi:molecular chaperone Hsp33